MEKVELRTADIAAENAAKLAELFPDIVTEVLDEDGNVRHSIDVEALKAHVGDIAEDKRERYQFTWPGKQKARAEAIRPIDKTMRPCVDESVNWDTTENLYIEGDNLDALKILRKTYAGKIKMIYIDPPYNTGHDFVYNDTFARTAEEERAESGAFDEEGNALHAAFRINNESDGRYHSNWCSLILPRLILAKDMLADDGLIFVSIGDEELSNLKKIMDEVFGASNFRNQIVVRRGAKSVQAQFETWDKLGKDYEHILLYSKCSNYRFPRQMKTLETKKAGAWNNHWRGTDRPTMRFELFGVTPESGQWRWGKERSERAADNYRRMCNELGSVNPSDPEIETWLSKEGGDIDLLRLSEKGKPEHYIPASNETLLNSSWMDQLVGSSSEIASLFKTKVFDTAKLTKLVIRMLGFAADDCLVLDFFSGSATTAHAVMQLNAEDGGNRKFIMVQLPEVCDEKSEAAKAGYKNICEIGKERIRRAGAKIAAEVEESNAQLKLGEESKRVPDIGFRVLKIDSSNFEDVQRTPDTLLQDALFGLADNVKPGRTPEDILFQLFPKLEIPYTARIDTFDICGKTVYSVDDDTLVACFDREVPEGVVRAMAERKPAWAVLRDASFTGDDALANFEEIFKTVSPETKTRVV